MISRKKGWTRLALPSDVPPCKLFMKRLLAFLIPFYTIAASAQAGNTSFHIPNRPLPERRVNDLVHLLLPDQQAKLEAALEKLDRARDVEAVLMIVKATGQDDLRGYAEAAIEKWGIGKEKGDRGLLWVLDISSKKIYIGIGQGLRSRLSEETCMRIINQDIVPAFEEQHYYEGLDHAIQGLGIVLIPLHELQRYADAYDRLHRNILIGILILTFGSGIVLSFTGKKRS